MSSQKDKDLREYGYLGETADAKMIHMRKGQFIGGYSIGIMHMDVWYPIIPGNVVNAWTYDFPVRMKLVPNLDTPRLHSADPSALEDIIKVAKELEADGCRAIAGACGFFGHFQKQVADAVDILVCMSSLIQVSWIRMALKSYQKIGIITANAAAITPQMLKNCYIEDASNLIIKDMRHEPQFSAIMEDRGSFDNEVLRKEVVSAAELIVRDHSDVGAILLECSDTPPYAVDVQRAVKLPVFDFITMIKWMHNATTQRPYYGFI